MILVAIYNDQVQSTCHKRAFAGHCTWRRILSHGQRWWLFYLQQDCLVHGWRLWQSPVWESLAFNSGEIESSHSHHCVFITHSSSNKCHSSPPMRVMRVQDSPQVRQDGKQVLSMIELSIIIVKFKLFGFILPRIAHFAAKYMDFFRYLWIIIPFSRQHIHGPLAVCCGSDCWWIWRWRCHCVGATLSRKNCTIESARGYRQLAPGTKHPDI